MKLLVDMNLSPEWARFLTAAEFESVHWSEIGAATAPDTEIMAYASSHGYVVLTQDLDFGAIPAATHSERPSVVQIRSEDLSPARIGKLILNALRVGESDLQSGALLTVDFQRIRMRLLPFPQK